MLGITIRMNATGIKVSHKDTGTLHFKGQGKKMVEMNTYRDLDGDLHVERKEPKRTFKENVFPHKEWAQAGHAIRRAVSAK